MSITAEDVQIFLNDYPEANRLLGTKLFDNKRIQRGIQFVVDEWNEIPPILSTKYTASNFPYKSTLLYGVCAWLFLGESTSQERNHLAYQSGGIAIDDSNKSNPYLSFYNIFKAEFTRLAESQKISENIKSGFRNIGSDYRYLKGI